jgi:hypothetical protein
VVWRHPLPVRQPPEARHGRRSSALPERRTCCRSYARSCPRDSRERAALKSQVRARLSRFSREEPFHLPAHYAQDQVTRCRIIQPDLPVLPYRT